MKRIAKILGGLILVALCIGVIYVLARSAIAGVQDISDRMAANRLHDSQAAAFPGTATIIAQVNNQINVEKTKAPTRTPTPTEADNGDNGDSADPSQNGQDGQTPVNQTGQTSQGAQVVTLISTQITALPPSGEAVSVLPSQTPSPLPTDAPTQTQVPSSTPTDRPTDLPTATVTLTSTATSTPVPPTSTIIPTNSPAPTLIAQALTLPPTNTKRAPAATSIPPTAIPTETPTLLPTLPPTATAPSATSVPATAAPVASAIPASPAALPTSKLPVVQLPGERNERPQPTAIPTHAPRVKANNQDILNILLIGSDQDVDPTDPDYRTDSMVIVSINRTANSVAMLSIPRDLFVYIPSLGMQRINTAFQWGESVKWQPGGGFGLLQQTILYNLGIPVHYYGRISFDGFKKIIDTVNGIDIAVDCPISDLRFQGQYDDKKTPVYSPYTLAPGFYHMDGSLALWYARMRHQTSDFDRNRRQQQILRAIWRTARDQGLIAKAPDLWGQMTSLVDTNFPLGDALSLVPLALSLKPGDISSYYMQKGYELQHWRTPAGEDVQIPDPKGFFQTITDFYTPPTTNRLTRDAGVIEILNGTSNKDFDRVAVDRLAWEGYEAQPKGPTDTAAKTVVYDFTGSAKPSTLNAIVKALGLKQSQVVSQPDPNRTVDYRIVIGSDYKSCTVPGFNQ